MLVERGSYLEGGEICTVRVRPVRIATVVPQGDPDAAVRAIAANCLLWGGMFNLLVPYSDTGFSSDWATILDYYDPDDIVDMVGLPESYELQGRRRHQFLRRWDCAADEQFPLRGATMYSVLRALRQASGNAPPVAVPHLETGDPMLLPSLARFGLIDERGFENTLHQYGVRERYDDLARVGEGTWYDRPSLIAGSFPSMPLTIPLPQSGQYWTPIRLTFDSLRVHFAPWHFGFGTPERPEYHEAFQDAILVTGLANDVGDLCLYWALRLQRPTVYPFPLWIPLDVLDSPEGRAGMAMALGRRDPRSLPPDMGFLVLSTSAPAHELQAIMNRLGVEAQVYTDRLFRFWSPEVRIGDQEETELRFDRGTARLRPPQARAFSNLREMDMVAVDVEIPNYELPAVPEMTGRVYGSIHRVARRGVTAFVDTSNKRELLRLVLPDRWTCLEAIFESAGCTCAPSDKARLALAILRMLGGIEYLNVLMSSRVYELLKHMAEAKAASRSFVEPARPDLQYDQIRTRLGSKYADEVIAWLLQRRIAIRGTRITCPNCWLAKWYPLDRVSAYAFRCDGCFEEMLPPLKVNTTQWTYRLNELVAKAFDQGVLIQLLTMLDSWDPVPGTSDARTLGFYPGVVLSYGESNDEGETVTREAEIDFVEIYDGRLIIGECKVTSSRIEQADLDRYVQLAAKLNCSRILFTAMDDVGAELEASIERSQATTAATIQHVNLRRGFDLRTRERQDAKRDDGIRGNPDSYLEHIVRYWLAR